MTAGLVRDGGTLQIGIGQIGDAVAQGLIIRHRDNAQFRDITARLGPGTNLQAASETSTFDKGLYGVSEMITEGFLGLVEASIVRRDINGAVLHGAFFLGPKAFYRALREMTPEQIARIQMRPVSFTNELYGDEAAKRAARIDARFINNAMMATLMGAVIADGLDNGQVVAVSAASTISWRRLLHWPAPARFSALETTRQDGAKVQSNVRWSYGHETIPRHLRDIIVTEYGVADLRGKSDADVIAAMLQVTDSQFQDELARMAKDAGKLPKHFELAPVYRVNVPERIAAALKPAREAGLLPAFPFGSDFTEVEQRLIPALQLLQDAQRAPLRLAAMLWQGLTGAMKPGDAECLARLGLDRPQNFPSAPIARWSWPRWRGVAPSNHGVVLGESQDPYRAMYPLDLDGRRSSEQRRPVVMGSGSRFAWPGRRNNHRFLFTGLRFSIKAAMPSARSSSAKVAWNRLRSTLSPSDSGVSKARLTASLAIAAAGRDIDAIFSAAPAPRPSTCRPAPRG